MPVPPALDPPRRILMGPGPSDTHPRVLAALGAPTVGHLDPYFLQVMDDSQKTLREVFRTRNELTLAVSGTGSSGMETCVVNLIEPGDKMVVCVNGVFGGRMADVAERAGAIVTKIERPYGEIIPVEEVAATVKKVSPKVFGIIHAETSTGAWQPLEEISKVVHEAGHALRGQVLDQPRQCAEVDAAVAQRGDERDPDAGKIHDDAPRLPG